MRSAPSAWKMPARTPGRSGTWTRSRCSAPASSYAVSRMRRRLPLGLADPAREVAGVPLRERSLELLDAAPVLGERRGERLAVLEEDVDPDARVGARDPRHVAERAPRRRQRIVAVDTRRARVVQEDVREGVGEVARHGDEAVVGVRVDRHGPRAECGHEGVGCAIPLGSRGRERRQEPGGALEEIRARTARPARLGAADRVPAHEARVRARRRADGGLRRADVGDRAVVRRRLEHLEHDRGKRGDRHRDERDLGVAQRLGQRARRVDGASLGRDLERRAVLVPADDVREARAPGGEADRGADEAGPDDG